MPSLALRYPQASVIVPGRKLKAYRAKAQIQYELRHSVTANPTSKQHLVEQRRFHISGTTG